MSDALESLAAAPEEAIGLAGPPAPVVERAEAPAGALEALRSRDFALLWGGAFVSNVGTWLANVALSWLVLEITDSAFWVSMVAFAQFFPHLVFGLAGGLVADRYDRRRLLISTQSVLMGLAFALGAVTLSDRASLATVFPILTVAGIVLAFNSPAFHALVPDLVPRRALLGAVSLNAAQFSASRVLGPAVGGAVVATAGAGWAFVANGVSFLAVIVALIAIRPTPAEHRDPSSGGVAEGLRMAWRTPAVRALLATLAAVSTLGAPILALLPVLARDVLGHRAGGFGGLFAILSAGAVAGSLATGRLVPRVGVRRSVAAGFGVLAAAMAGLALSRTTILSGGLLAAIGFVYAAMLSVTNTGLQTAAAAGARGRLMSLFMMCWAGLYPLGALAAGGLADTVGVSGALWILAMALAVAGGVVRLRGNSLDRVDL